MSLSENGKQSTAAVDPVIEIRQLTRLFDKTTAVDQLSFEVMSGEVFGFIGPNGAGKTTTMRILSTLDVPTHGSAFVDGFSVIDDPDRVRRRLGFMPDGFGTYPNVNCEEYLDFFARSYGLKGAERRAALKYVMEFTQLDRLAQKPVDGLSKGMKQRLCLGRALIHDPSVLILDEPAAGLDPRARIELREMIVKLAADGKALLISSHILTELAEMCDRVAIIEKGQLLAVGTVDEILNNTHNRLNVDSQFGSAAASTLPVLAVTVLGDTTAAVQFISQQEHVSEIMSDSQTIQFCFAGELADRAALLESIIGHGIGVVSFQVKEKSLEEAFLTVTQGIVQ